ncbi:MAG: methyltransferase domain-containing protein [Planctomycetes bacterium]|nr:methyltransferase domain-containing protein [Planctomycetota bacterium]
MKRCVAAVTLLVVTCMGLSKSRGQEDVAFVATPHDVVSRMLALAELRPSDVVYDLGCGDGRIVALAARRHGCKGVGIDINPARVRDSLALVRRHDVAHLVKIERANIFDVDLRPASVVFLYLLPELNVKLLPQLRQLQPGSRVVSHLHGIAGAAPAKTLRYRSREDGVEHALHLWITPIRRTEKP